MFGCGVGVPHPMGGAGRWFFSFCARAELGSPRSGFSSICIEVEMKKGGAKMVVFEHVQRLDRHPYPTPKVESRPRRPFVECLGVGEGPHIP